MLQKPMYKKSDPQQKLFGVDSQLSPTLRNKLQISWAELFRKEVLPILFRNEDQYAMLYGKTGRPNFSVARIVGLCLLQELNSLSDQEALDAYSFDIRWRYALDVSDEEDYLSRRSLVEFRRRLSEKDPNMELIRGIFDNIRDAAINKLDISVRNQRLDSTHVISNIRVRSRLELFSRTLTLFLKSLDNKLFSKIPKSIQKWHINESEGWFALGPAEQKTKLIDLARYIYKLILIFEKNWDVKNSESYQILDRLFQEQCEVIQKGASKKRSAKNVEILLKIKTEGESLQSPYDPDASYGHKGSGYSAQITETCNNSEKPEIITDYEVHGAARSDMGKAVDIVERLNSTGLKPDTLFADGGYPSVPTAFKIVENDVDFITPVNRAHLSRDVMGMDRFKYDSDGLAIKCPMGHSPIDHRILSANNTTSRSLHAIFNGDICRACHALDICPVRAPNHRVKGTNARDTVGNFRLDVSPQLLLRDKMYSRQKTVEWKNQYKIRSGIEATMSELVRSHGLRKLRVRRSPKVTFAVACKVIACNIKRWARALAASNIPFQLFRSVIFAHLKLFQINLINKRYFRRTINCLQF